ncbi:MAG: SH3 domain-containing protein [Candidatus Margulisbacteria bacterium]|nr:SH3 domain-containing protein [Candidatus Margulisiibacteriota bacterium]
MRNINKKFYYVNLLIGFYLFWTLSFAGNISSDILSSINECPVLISENSENNVSLNILQDLITLTQNPLFYLNPSDADKALLSDDEQVSRNSRFNKIFFIPWHQYRPYYSKTDIQGIINRYKSDPGFGENKLKHSIERVFQLEKLAGLQDYPNTKRKAITVRNTSLRLLPTSRPLFDDFNQAGQGYPFDNLQNSGIAVNTPVYISHQSVDGSWVLAESSFALGWIPADDIAYVDDEFVSSWEFNKFLAVVKDNSAIYNTGYRYGVHANIGSIFPDISYDIINNIFGFLGSLFDARHPDNDYYTCLYAAADSNRNAIIKTGKILKTVSVKKPEKISQKNIASLAVGVMEQPYGWGDMYEDRDCASLIKDLFVPFGIWLPRNGNYQANAGYYMEINVVSSDEKEKIIQEKAVPFFTLVWLKGHIMLYIGSYENKPLVLHNMWGIKTINNEGQEGRFIVGKTVITTLEPGKELPDIYKPLIERVRGITYLGKPMEEIRDKW